MTRDIERARETLARDRATLATLQRLDARGAAPASAPPPCRPTTRAQPCVARSTRADCARAAQLDVREGRVVAGARRACRSTRWSALARRPARTAGLRVVEARLLARVEPGTVRAEITLGR